MAYLEILNIERLEMIEERLGISINGLNAEIEYADRPDEDSYLLVRGEILPTNGCELMEDIELVMNAFDLDGKCVATNSRWFNKNNFFGLDSFEFQAFTRSKNIQRIRVFVKKS